MRIDNIRVEPNSNSHVFVAHGTVLDYRGNAVTQLVTVDLKSLLSADQYTDCNEVGTLF